MRGRYEDDDFEPLGVMLVPEESILSVHIIEAEERVPVIRGTSGMAFHRVRERLT